MRILRKGKELLETFKCKLGYHEWVAVHGSEFLNRDIVGQSFLRKVGEEKPSIMRNVM